MVELIVVITILAILWTIAFIAMQGYSKDARDSVRLTDLRSAESWLEIFNVNAWKYPEPDEVTLYTWWTVELKQGVVWEWVIRNVWLDKIIKDPKTDNNYVYSIFWSWQYYQLWAEQEWDSIWMLQKIKNNWNFSFSFYHRCEKYDSIMKHLWNRKKLLQW